MKKKILLILMFITMFFIGNNNVFARCKVGDNGCKDSILKLEQNDKNQTLSCLYEVSLNDGRKFYNYIFYNPMQNQFEAGTSIKNVTKLETINISDNPFVTEDARKELYNGTCPSNSYIDTNKVLVLGENEICFDNNGECKNDGKKYNVGTNFNKTKSSTLVTPKNFELGTKYSDTTLRGSCNTDNKLLTKYGNMCRYINSATNDTILLYYNSNETYMIYNAVEDNEKFVLKYNEQYSYTTKIEKDGVINKVLGRETKHNNKYYNGISGLNSCPNSLVLYTHSYNPKNNLSNAIHNDFYIYASKPSQEPDAGKIHNVDTETEVKKYDNNFILSPCSENPNGALDPSDVDCSLIDGVLIDEINSIMAIIRIAIPIILIGLVTYDFATAVFAGADDKVKKAKDKAIKRVIIAILIFFVPTFVNVIFNIANDVWEDVNYEICGMELDD